MQRKSSTVLYAKYLEFDKRAAAFIARNKSVLLIMAVGLMLRLFMLGQVKDAWHDEAFQYLYSLKPLGFILAGNDVHPPLFNIFTHYLVQYNIFSNDIVTLRWVGAGVFSIGFLFLFYHLVKDIFGEKAAFWSGMLLAVTPTYLYYSVEFRSYSWVLFFMAMQCYAYAKLIKHIDEEPGDLTFWNIGLRTYQLRIIPIFYVALSLVLLYSHYLTAPLLLVQLVFYLYLYWRREIHDYKPILRYFAIIAALCIPLLVYTLLMLSKAQSFWFKDIGWRSLVSSYAYVISPPLNVVVGVTLIVYGIAIYGLWTWRKLLESKHALFMAYLIVPNLLMWLVSITLIPLFHPRYFIFGGIGLFVLAGWSLAKIGEREHEFDMCLFAFYCLWVFVAWNHGFSDTFHHELTDSALALQKYGENNTDCINDCAIIHTSQFSQSPYKLFFPQTKNYLISNFTAKQQFTRGGSVIADDEVYQSIEDVPKMRYMYYVSNIKHDDWKTLFEEDGLYVQQIK
jgi:hypothetical protein